MGQFKPMVKMYTDEPSVILKLKKGGKVAKKADGGFMPMASTQPAGLPARGGSAPAASPMRPSLAVRRRAMNPNLMKKGGAASGAKIDAAETKTTIESGAKKFAKTKMDTAHKDRAHGTGEVKEGKPGGYKMGGTIEGNEGKFANTKVNDGDKADKAHGTGGVRMGNAGGFKSGGKAVKKASGGTIDKKLTRTTVEGGNWENRPANSAKPGKTNTKTGEVKEANAGGYKKGGSAKKAYATGGNVVSDGKASAMPRKPVSRPVANSLQSGTFKRGGKVGKFAVGGDMGEDASKGAYDKSIGPSEEDMEMAKSIRAIPSKLYEGVKSGAKSLMGAFKGTDKAPGAVTKTKESVTVAPRKRGGKC